MGKLLAQYDKDCDWVLAYAKSGDVGLDLPIRIRGSIVAMGIGDNQNLESQHLEHFVKPDGDVTDPTPWLEVPPGGYAEIETGVRVKCPDDAWAIITGRSSTAWKRRLIVIQGIIDSGYIGYLRNLVFNPNPVPKRVHEGDRLAQLIVLPKYPISNIIGVDELPSTERGESGFGSSGN